MRVLTLAAFLSAVLLMSACTSSERGSPADDPADPAAESGCGECIEELADARTVIEALPDVEELVTLETYSASPTNGAGVRVELRARSTGDPAVVDEVGRVIWQSRLAPVDEVFVTVEDASGELVRGSSPLDFADTSRQHATYVEQWGPRPVG